MWTHQLSYCYLWLGHYREHNGSQQLNFSFLLSLRFMVHNQSLWTSFFFVVCKWTKDAGQGNGVIQLLAFRLAHFFPGFRCGLAILLKNPVPHHLWEVLPTEDKSWDTHVRFTWDSWKIRPVIDIPVTGANLCTTFFKSFQLVGVNP